MFRTIKVLSFVLCAAMATCTHGAVMVISDVTTDTTALDGNLTAITAGDALGVTAFASATANDENNITHLEGSTPPANASDALSDQRADTGKLSAGADTIFAVTPTVSAEKLFIIFNAANSAGFYQGPGVVTARDTNGDAIGSAVSVNVDNDGLNSANDAVVLGDEFANVNLARVGSSTLNGRLLLGVTIDVADFGVSDLSTINGFTVAGELETGAAFAGSFDVHTVGLALVPEPTSLVLLGFGLLGILTNRRGA